MSALPSLVPDDIAPSSRAVRAAPVDAGATVVPLIHGARGPVGVANLRPRGATAPTVLRPALFERLAEAHAVTVISAPAASGKTSLLRSWIAEAGLSAHAASVTVWHDEHDERRFWLSVLDALTPFARGEALATGEEASAPGGDRIVERLVSGPQALNEPGLLVIDDLHELKSPEGRAQLERFLTRLPARLRVVLLTRDAIGLGLHRLRLAGALTELRSADLRFSVQETRELLDAAGIALSDAGVAMLHRRTDGWVGALRLAAALLVGHADPERFVREFSGSERTVAGYLRAEVLDHQPPEVRDLLLRTSVLERVSGPLADALSGGSGSERALQELDAAGAFVTPLDVGRSWFRYHPMFADFLRMELRRVNPTLIPTLHRVAGQWHEHHGDIVEAIRHAQAAGDWHHAVLLLADNHLTLILDGRMAAVRDLLGAFPPQASITDAELALVSATADAADGLYDDSAAHIAVAERLACTLPDDRRRPVELGLAGTRLWLARLRGDVAGASEAFRSTELALTAQPPREGTRSSLHHATALANLGIAEVSSPRPGRRPPPPRAGARARTPDRAAVPGDGVPRPPRARGRTQRLVGMRRAPVCRAGGLDRRSPPLGHRSGGRGCARGGGSDARVAGPLHGCRGVAGPRATGAGRRSRSRDRGAASHLEGSPLPRAVSARRRHGSPPARRRRLGGCCRASTRPGSICAVASCGHSSRPGRTRPYAPPSRTCPLPSATRPRYASPPRPSSSPRAMRSARSRRSARSSRTRRPTVYPGPTAMEALLIHAAAHEELGDARAVEASLERALAIAEPDGIVLPFALVPVRALLERHRSHRTAHAALLATILDILGGGSPEPEVQALREPLSHAELRVVRYLPSNLKAAEIASGLCVSPNTVRTHLRHIYAKLDAHTRSEAVTRARRLGLLAPAGLSAR